MDEVIYQEVLNTKEVYIQPLAILLHTRFDRIILLAVKPMIYNVIFMDNDSELVHGCNTPGVMRSGAIKIMIGVKYLKWSILSVEGLDIRSITMLSRPYVAASVADRSCGTTSFPCLLLTGSLSCVITWALLLPQIDISLEDVSVPYVIWMVIASLSPHEAPSLTISADAKGQKDNCDDSKPCHLVSHCGEERWWLSTPCITQLGLMERHVAEARPGSKHNLDPHGRHGHQQCHSREIKIP